MATLRMQRKKQNAYESLERMLNKTTLTTQRVAHNHIIELGDDLLNRTTVVLGENKDQAVVVAVQEADQRYKDELESALTNLREQLEKEREEALHHQKMCHENLQAKALEQWEKAQEEKIRLLKLEYSKLLQEALQSQSDEFEGFKQSAVDEACRQLEKRMRNAFSLEREHAVANALGKARIRFREREQEIIDQTKLRCKEEMEQEISKLRAKHEEEMKPLVNKYNILHETYSELIEDNKKLEKDFEELQRDYMRFLDNTGGRFHSDYMIVPRSHSTILSADSVATISSL